MTTGARAAGPLIFVAVGAGYLAVAQFVQWLNDPGNVGASLWLAAGLSLAALLLTPPRLWPWVLGAVAVAEVGGDLALGYPLAASLGWGLANTAEPLVGALLLRRFGNPRGELVPVRNLFAFLTCAVIAAPLVGATIGAFATAFGFGGGGDYPEVWAKYVVGDALGVLIVAPVLLTWHLPFPSRSRWEILALVAGTLTAVTVVFSGVAGDITASLAYILIVFLVWAALRVGVRGTALLAFAVTMVANWFTAEGSGPFAVANEAGEHAVILLQLFLGIAVSSALLVAALVSELRDRDEVERALRHQAEHDALTGLPNRARLAAAIEAALVRAPDGQGIALLACDIDHLKAVNDSLGHRAGDEFIAHVGRRLTESVRADDVVSRISGDEFVVVLHEVDLEAVDALCERIIRNVTRPVVLRTNTEVTPSLSIGVALGRAGMSGEELFGGADTALFEAKRQGRGRTVHFDERLRAAAGERTELEADLPRGLSEGQIRCLHQPEIVLATGEVFAFESLARWYHPRRGKIMPDVFVPVVDAMGQAAALFEEMLAQTLAAQASWYAATGFRPSVAVNVSALQLRDPALPLSVGRALDAAGAPADSLWLELTETAQADNGASAALADLVRLGVHLALGDFGTGWSSMTRLSEFPWEVVKLDRSFIGRLGADDEADHVVRAMIDMAHALGIRVVAEGVETAGQLDRLRSHGCDIAQGFLFSRPVDAETAGASLTPDGMWRGVGPGPVATGSTRPALRGSGDDGANAPELPAAGS